MNCQASKQTNKQTNKQRTNLIEVFKFVLLNVKFNLDITL